MLSQPSYPAIADGFPVDVAIVEARGGTFAADNEVERAIPALYLRSPDGCVFTRNQVSEAEGLAQEEARLRDHEDAERNVREETERPTLEKAGPRHRRGGPPGHNPLRNAYAPANAYRSLSFLWRADDHLPSYW